MSWRVVAIAFILFWALFGINALIVTGVQMLLSKQIPLVVLAGLASLAEIVVIATHSVEALLMGIANKTDSPPATAKPASRG